MNTNINKMLAIATLIATAFALPVSADAIVKRYLLSAGANNGGQDRVLLRYAVTDANAFAAVFLEMGGVEKNNAVITADPTRRELLNGFAILGKLIASGKTADPSVKSEAFVYYSGHADESGLKLNGETLSWADFRAAVNSLDADVRVAVLDACGAGAITRAKGGAKRPAILSDASSSMKGYAFLTSSNEIEASQESDRIRGSYFTYALVSGMRGAADMTGDGKVTINEAYQYAFNETLQSTQNTKGGTQHPSRDMNLVGTGDIVMTDLRETSATLSLDGNIEGRLFIRDGRGNLFAELHKTRGRAIELGIPPGVYAVQMETPSKSWLAGSAVIAEGKKTALDAGGLKAMSGRKESVLIRGNIGGGGAREQTRRPPNPLFDSACRAPVGLMSVFCGGVYDLTYYADACGDMGVTLRTGTSWLNTVFEYQQSAGGWGEWPKAWGVGVGTRFGMDGAFYVNADAVWSVASYYTEGRDTTVYERGDGKLGSDLVPRIIRTKSSFCPSDGLAKLRFGGNYRARPYMSLNAGATVNALFEELYGRKERERENGTKVPLDQPFNTGTMWGDYTIGEGGQRLRLWLSFYAGLTVGIPAGQINLKK